MSIIVERVTKFNTESEKKAFLTKIHDLDVDVYTSADAGSTENMIQRYKDKLVSFIVIKDTSNDDILGYVNFFPCKLNLKAKILNKNTPYDALDDQILAEDIEDEYIPGNKYFIYILSIMVRKEYRYDKSNPDSPNYMELLTKELLAFLREKNEEGCIIEALAGCVVSPGGERFARYLRFRFDHYVLNSVGEIAINNDPANNVHNYPKRIMICDNGNLSCESVVTVYKPVDEKGNILKTWYYRPCEEITPILTDSTSKAQMRIERTDLEADIKAGIISNIEDSDSCEDIDIEIEMDSHKEAVPMNSSLYDYSYDSSDKSSPCEIKEETLTDGATDEDICSDGSDSDDESSADGGCLHQLLEQGPYKKSWKDDIYLFIPLAEHEANEASKIFYQDTDNPYDILELFSSKTNASDENKKSKRKAKSQKQKSTNKTNNSTNNSYDWKDFVLNHNGNSQIPKRIITQLKDCIEYECDNNVAKSLRILYLGCYDFLHTTDQYPAHESYDPVNAKQDIADSKIINRMYSFSEEELEIGWSQGYVFLTLHPLTHMYILCVFFPNYKYSSTQLLDQLSNNYIKIIDPTVEYNIYKSARRYRYIRLYDFLWENFRLHRCGQEKALLCMSNKPDTDLYKTEFLNILNAEVYNSTKVDYHIDSTSSREQAEFDHSKYDYYESYMSNKVIAYIPNDYGNINDRIDSVATISFIVELVMFQNTAMARMNKKVTKALTSNDDISMEEILDLNQEYGRTIPFWEPNNFVYLGAQAEANEVKVAFSNEEMKSTYNEFQEFLEHLVDLKSSERENKNSMVLNIVATILAIIQVEGFIEGALISFYQATGIGIHGDYADFTKSFNNSLLGTLLILLIIIFVRHKRSQKKLRDKLKK